MSSIVYGQHERDMWLEMVKRIYAANVGSFGHDAAIELSHEYADDFCESMAFSARENGEIEREPEDPNWALIRKFEAMEK